MGLLLSSLQKEVLLFTWVGTGDMAARNGGSTANSLLPTSEPGGEEDGPWQSSSWGRFSSAIMRVPGHGDPVWGCSEAVDALRS